jgi:cell fate regulator YaaT (PSP1 superfamily)
MELEGTTLKDSGIKIVGIRLKDRGIVVHYDPQDINMLVGDYVIIETENGEEITRVVSLPRYVLRVLNNQPLKKVLRLATPEDISRLQEHSKIEREAFIYCVARIKDRGLPMKVIDVEYSFDENRMFYYFSSDSRVDFRELVKDLAYKYSARIELRQVGIRDGARMISGYGHCGRPLCCATFLMEFAPVSIKMARDQDMVINPVKISGMCGRLMCCIAYEHGVEDGKG